ncbi:hypothetical protein IJ750_05485 [bacterium]|nr:hypothetical protein [bacterium]
MANPYSAGNQSQMMYNYQAFQPQVQGNSSGEAGEALGMATLGFLGGGGYGYFKYRHPVKNGEVSDTFARKAFDRYINKGLDSKKKTFYEQAKKILKKIDNVGTPEEFKSLLTKNKAVNNYAFPGFTLKEMCNAVTSSNLNVNKENMKNALDTAYKKDMETMRGYVKLCWNAEKKKLVKQGFIDNKIFNAIKDTCTKTKWLNTLKYGGIGAGILGGVTLLYKSVMNYLMKKNIEQAMQAQMQQTPVNQIQA